MKRKKNDDGWDSPLFGKCLKANLGANKNSSWGCPVEITGIQVQNHLNTDFFAKQLETNAGNVHYALLMPDKESKNCGVRAVAMSDKKYVVLNTPEHAPKGFVQINQRSKK